MGGPSVWDPKVQLHSVFQSSLASWAQRVRSLHCCFTPPRAGPFSLSLSFLWLPRDGAGGVIPGLLGSFGLWRRDAAVVPCNVGEWVWFLSVTLPGCATGASQKGTGPSPKGTTGKPNQRT